MKIKYAMIMVAVIAIGLSLFVVYFPLAIPGRTRQITSPNGRHTVIVDVNHSLNSENPYCVRITIRNQRGESEFQYQTNDPCYRDYIMGWDEYGTLNCDGCNSSYIVWKFLNGSWTQVL